MNDQKNIMREALQKWREEGGVVKTRKEKFEENPTRKLAIERFCIQCMGGEENEGYRNHIKTCPSVKTCPLYIYRPYK